MGQSSTPINDCFTPLPIAGWFVGFGPSADLDNSGNLITDPMTVAALAARMAKTVRQDGGPGNAGGGRMAEWRDVAQSILIWPALTAPAVSGEIQIWDFATGHRGPVVLERTYPLIPHNRSYELSSQPSLQFTVVASTQESWTLAIDDGYRPYHDATNGVQYYPTERPYVLPFLGAAYSLITARAIAASQDMLVLWRPV